MALIAYLSSGRVATARLRGALGEEHRLQRAEDWPGLRGLLASAEAPDACIVDLDYPTRPILLGDLRQLRMQHPALALVVYGRFPGRDLQLFHLGRIGVDEIILAEQEDEPGEVRKAVNRALARVLAARVEERLRDCVPPLGLQAIRWSVEHAHRAPRVSDLANALRVHPRTLSRRLRSLGLPPASRLLLWGRLLRAARLLEDPTTTVESVAYRMGYSSAAALRRALKRETGTPPSRVPDRGGDRWIFGPFLREAGRRDPGRPRDPWSRPRVGSSPRRRRRPARSTA